MSPRSAVRVSNLTPQLVLQNAAGTFDPSVALSYVFEMFEGEGQPDARRSRSDPISAGSPQTIYNVPSDMLKLNTTYAWRAYAVYPGAVPADPSLTACHSEPRCRRRRWTPIPRAGLLRRRSRAGHHRVRRQRRSRAAASRRTAAISAMSGASKTWSSSATRLSRPANARA